jgi:hypothetical protein
MALLVPIAMALPRTLLGCAVCFSANDASAKAFLDTTIFLSLTPLLFLGGAGFWLWRRVRALEALDAAPRPLDD